jgi:hypothetical protein
MWIPTDSFNFLDLFYTSVPNIPVKYYLESSALIERNKKNDSLKRQREETIHDVEQLFPEKKFKTDPNNINKENISQGRVKAISPETKEEVPSDSNQNSILEVWASIHDRQSYQFAHLQRTFETLSNMISVDSSRTKPESDYLINKIEQYLLMHPNQDDLLESFIKRVSFTEKSINKPVNNLKNWIERRFDMSNRVTSREEKPIECLNQFPDLIQFHCAMRIIEKRILPQVFRFLPLKTSSSLARKYVTHLGEKFTSLPNIFERFPNLISISINPKNIGKFSLNQLNQLHELKINFSPWEAFESNIRDLSYIKTLTSLRSLVITGSGFTNLPDFSTLPNLKKLKITLYNFEYNFDNLLLQFTGLESLDLISDQIKNVTLQTMHRLLLLTKLAKLNIKSCSSQYTFANTTEVVRNPIIHVFTNLTSLNVAYTSDWDLDGIKQLPKLKNLEISSFMLNSSLLFGQLNGLRSLRVPVETINYLYNCSHLKNLTELDIYDNSNDKKINSYHFSFLKHFEQLKILKLNTTNLYPSIDDIILSKLTKLETLTASVENIETSTWNRLVNLQTINDYDFSLSLHVDAQERMPRMPDFYLKFRNMNSLVIPKQFYLSQYRNLKLFNQLTALNIDLNFNKISTSSLCELTHLKKLTLKSKNELQPDTWSLLYSNLLTTDIIFHKTANIT